MPTNNNNMPLEAAFPPVADSRISAHAASITAQLAKWQVVDALWGGTTTMRQAGERFLPRRPKESDAKYQARLNRTYLHNYFKSSVETAVGKVFAKDVVVEDADSRVELLADDIDAQGRDLTQFGRDVLTDAVRHGIAFILVDYTRVEQPHANLAAKLASGARPYWLGINAPMVLETRTKSMNGTHMLSYFRFLEQVEDEADSLYAPESHRQVRIYQQHEANGPVLFAVYRQDKEGNWVLRDSGQLQGVTHIPVIPVYTNRTGLFAGTPPLQDLADVNIQHYQCGSDYYDSLYVASIPFLLAKGLPARPDEFGNIKEFVIDVHTTVASAHTETEVEWIESSGTALEAARKNLDDLKAQMERQGMTLCSSLPGNATATEKSVNASEAHSVIKAWALSLQDAFDYAFQFTAQYLGVQLASQGKTAVNTDYAIDYAESSTFGNVLGLFDKGLIDGERVVLEAKRRNIIDPSAVIEVLEVEPIEELPKDQEKEEEPADEKSEA